MHIFEELNYIDNSSLALGFFDGVHLAHNVVLKNAVKIAKKNNTQSCVITFKEHPQNTLSSEKVPLILTLDERINLIEKTGIDNLVMLDFNKYINIRAKEYLENIIIKYYSPIAITTGFNHSFGYKKEGSGQFLKENSDKYNYKYYEIPPYVIDGNIVSCSAIRNGIMLGDFILANKLLGYNFFINSTVTEGEHLASKIGFPSANINYSEDKIKIPFGVYYVIVSVLNKNYNGIFNYGYSPTFNNKDILKAEVHIIDFNENIYGEKIKISFITKIRNQMKFENKEKLKEQINRDIAFADIYKHFLHKNNFIL